jgi:Ca-activated chloride channel family protein
MPVAAQMLVPRVEQGAEDRPPLEIKSQHVSVTIDNQVATTSVEQVFVNNTDIDLEAVYFVPLPEAASVSEFAYWVKGKRIVGEVREKQEARQIYESIVARKRDPGLLEKVGRNLFRASIYPVSPKEPMKVELEYQQVLPYDSGLVTYTYPLTVNGQQETIRDLTILATLKDQKPIATIDSPTHKLSITQEDDHNARLSYEAARIKPDKDFTVHYNVSSKEFGVTFLTHRKPNENGYFMLMVAPQEETTQADIVKKDIVFVFDKSGSMSGEKIEQARRALKFCLEHLESHDRFNLVTFCDSLSTFKKELVDADKGNIREAVGYVDGLEAAGGTDINSALTTALGPPSARRIRPRSSTTSRRRTRRRRGSSPSAWATTWTTTCCSSWRPATEARRSMSAPTRPSTPRSAPSTARSASRCSWT